MGKAVIFMGIAIVILLIIISMQIPRISQAENQAANARLMADTTKALLRELDVRCTARNTDFLGIRDCITPVLSKNDFSVQRFDRFDERRNETGQFIITNEGAKTYNGSLFALKKNGEEIIRGCHIEGNILPEYTCRFTLNEPCLDGDVYDITYEEDIRLATETC